MTWPFVVQSQVGGGSSSSFTVVSVGSCSVSRNGSHLGLLVCASLDLRARLDDPWGAGSAPPGGLRATCKGFDRFRPWVSSCVSVSKTVTPVDRDKMATGLCVVVQVMDKAGLPFRWALDNRAL